MQEIQEDYYAILGAEESAGPDDIRKAYLKLAKRLHPDKFPNEPEKRSAAQAEFARVTRAHEVLGDQKQKEEYDALRALARNRAALDAGVPGTTVPAGQTSGTNQAASSEVKAESKETWAAKHSGRAQECYDRKRFQEAETAVKEAIRLDPNKTKYHNQLANIYIARGWKTLALTEVQASLKIDPQDGEAKQIELKMKATQKGLEKKDGAGGFLSKLFGKK